MITRPRQTARLAMMPALAERLRYACTAHTFLTCAVGNNFNPESPSIFRFVRSESKELTPTSIVNRLAQHSASKPFYIQIFYCYQSEVVDQPSANSMVKVSSLVAHKGVGTLQDYDGLTPSLRSFLSSRYAPLGDPQSTFCFTVIVRIVNFSSVAQSCERSQPNINADHIRIKGQWLRYVLANEHRKPMSAFALDRKRLDRASERARYLDSHLADFREPEAISLQCVSDLSERDGVVAAKRTEARIAWLRDILHSHRSQLLAQLASAKERFESLIDAGDHILQRVSVHIRGIVSDCANLRQLANLIKATERLSFESPRFFTFSQGRIIKFRAHCQLIVQSLRLTVALGRFCSGKLCVPCRSHP